MIGKILKRTYCAPVTKKLAYLSGVPSVQTAENISGDQSETLRNGVPLICDDISSKLRKQAKALGPHSAHVFYQHGISYSYEELDQRVDEVAKGLIALGLKKGDRVGMYSPNRPEWILTQYA